MNDQIQIRLSAGSWAGLAILSAFSVGLFCASMIAFHPKQSNQANILQPSSGSAVPYGRPAGEYAGAIQKLPQPAEAIPPVNTTARDEIKQQSPCATGNCLTPQRQPYQTVNYSQSYSGEAAAESQKHGATLRTVRDARGYIVECYAILQDGRIWNATGSNKTTTYAGNNCFLAVLSEVRQGARSPVVSPAVKPVISPAPSPAVPTRTPKPASKPIPADLDAKPRYQLAIFVNETGGTLEKWFDSHSGLAHLKKNCAFEIYTPSNALYRHRYASVVPVKNFPAVLLLQPSGGHIYASGGPMLPKSAEALYGDMKESYHLAKSVESAPIHEAGNSLAGNSGTIKETGYNWDTSINPEMQLIEYQDCPDGNCPVEPAGWRPGDRVRDLFGPKDDPFSSLKNAIVWTSASEVATFVLLGLVVLLGFAIFRKING